MKIQTCLLICAVAIGCNSSTNDKNETVSNETKTMAKEFYGKLGDDSVYLYTLRNKKGMEVKITNYGGTVTSIMVPDKNGEMGDVVLGFDSFQGYLHQSNPYFGCIVGRYANRIANGKFELDGNTYSLAQNNGANSLHGGRKGFDKVVWDVKAVDSSSITLHYLSKDMEEGYPGNLDVTVVYSISDDNELKIDYTANTDKATPVNLTNHAYFNLSAGKDSTILDHELMIKSDKYTAVNAGLIPTGQLPEVKNTPMDFNTPKRIGQDITKVPGGPPVGYDHNWVLNKSGENNFELVATVFHPASGRFMEVYTTQPGVQFYSGNFLDGTLTGRNGVKYVKHAGLCLETQHFPDSPNQVSFPNTIVKPGETYHHVTSYKFSTR